jgi:HEAT repeat protein
MARSDQRPRIRSQALFWLSQRAGDEALRTIGNAVSDDPEIEVKRRAVFALSQLPRGEGVPLLIDLARNHRLPEVRRQAMFWLGQSKDPRAVDFFEQILRTK